MNIKRFKRGEDVRLSANFHLREFECSCGMCPDTPVDLDHVERLQAFREKLGMPIRITSGYRCPVKNKAVGGATKSQHMVGTATDLMIKGMTGNAIGIVAEEFYFDGIGKYRSFCHVDSRGYKARW